MQLGLSGCTRERKATKKLAMYSKQWSPGDTVHVLYKVFKVEETQNYEFMAGMCWGYPVNDIKGLGLKTTFIPALCKFNADGQPIGKPDILWRFSRLAPSFVKGAHEAEIANIMKKPGCDDAMRRSLIRDCDEKYDTKNNIDAIRPVIGRATPLIVLEALVVPMKEGVPTFDTLVVAMQPVSDTLSDRLTGILQTDKFKPVDGEDWIEIEYAYPMDAKKSVSGQKVVPTGVVAEDRISVKFPAQWEKIKIAMSGMSSDSDMIIKRSTSAVSEARIITALSKYVSYHSDDLNSCSLADDALEGLTSTIGVIHELNRDAIVTDPKVKEILDKAIVEINEEAEPLVPATEEASDAPASAAEVKTPDGEPVTTIEQLVKEQDASETAVQDFMDNIDLSALSGE